MDHEERLRLLTEYGIMDTERDPAFDALTMLAANILGVPMSFVAFLDDQRQWFKSTQNVPLTQTTLEDSFCQYVLEPRQPMTVHDATEDQRFRQNPYVLGAPHIRFYTGVPLKSPSGCVFGTICGLDDRPHEVSPKQVELLTVLADQAVALLELRRAKQQLMARQQTVDALLRGMADGVVMQAADGRILVSNPNAAKILGLSEDELTGRSSLDPRWRSVHEDGSHFPGEEHPAMVAIRTRLPQHDVVMGVHTPGGSLRWINVRSEPVAASTTDGEAVVTLFRDITCQREADQRAADSQRQLARRERLITAGNLAAGVAHEINNPLAYLVANLEYLSEEVRVADPESPLLPVIADAHEGAERIREVVQAMRTFAREAPRIGPTDVGNVLDVALRLTAHAMRPVCQCHVDVGDLPLVHADESLLAQVFVHVLVNAAQSFGGEHSPHHRVNIAASVGDERVKLTIRDNGQGITEEDLSHVLEPFFTTREVGQGTGLGLSVSHGIIESFGGTLRVSSPNQEGTLVEIILKQFDFTETL